MNTMPGIARREISASRRVASLLLAAGLLALLPGCGILRAPQQVVKQVVSGGSSQPPNPLDLQLELQRYADEFGAQSSAGIDEYVRRVGTESARINGLKWKVGANSAAVMIASGPRPKANLLDLAALSTLMRMSIEDRSLGFTNAPAVQPWLDAARLLETNIWRIASDELTPFQVQELHEAILGWHARHPEARDAFFARPQELASLVKKSSEQGARANSVFDLVNLDPTAGLDPAVREVTLTRLFAERAMYTMQRLPFLLRLQATLLTEQVTQQPGIQNVLTNTAQISESADRISRSLETAAGTIAQVPDRISAERKAILTALDQQAGKLKELTSQVDLTLRSGEEMSTSLNATLGTFDALMKRFGVGEPSKNAARSTNLHPFNVLEYGQVADQVGAMAKELDSLVRSVNQNLPKAEHLSQAAVEDAQKLVDHAFRLGLVLIAVLLIGAVTAGLAYRFLAGKLPPRGGVPAARDP